MKMVLPIVSRFRYPIAISLILALLIGTINIPGNLLGITRTFIYMPIFLIGFYYKSYQSYIKQHYEKLADTLSRDYVKYLIFVLIVIACIFAAATIPSEIILLQHPYKNHFLTKMFLKFIVISLGILFALNFNSIMTNKECFLTKIGKNSMAVYLLHPYFVKYLIKPFILQHFNHGIVFTLVVFVSLAIVVYVLSRDFVTDILNRFIDAIFRIFVDETKSS